MQPASSYTNLLATPTAPDIRVGDTVRVHQKVKEGAKTRVQIFEGIVISRKHGSENGASITVRKISQGIGVERIFPLYLSSIDKIEIAKRAKVRQAKLYYLRSKTSRETRKKLKSQIMIPGQETLKEIVAEEEIEAPAQ